MLEPPEHDLVAVAAFVVFDGLLALSPTGDAGVYPLVFQGFSEPIRIIATVTKEPFHIWQVAEQGSCSDVVTDVSGGDKEVQRAALAVTDGV